MLTVTISFLRYMKGENSMTEKALANNQAVVAGEIISEFVFSHEIFGEGFYMVDLLVSRLSDATDVIPLMVSDRLIDVHESHIGERIEAKGQFRSYNKHDELRFYFKYSDREDAEYMRIGTDGYNYYFNENLQLVREEKIEGNQTTVWEINVYDEIGLLKEDFHKTKNYDRRKEYEYDENGNCVKG